MARNIYTDNQMSKPPGSPAQQSGSRHLNRRAALDKKVKPRIARGSAPKDMLTKQRDDTGLFVALLETYMAETAATATQQDTGATDGSFITILVHSGLSEHCMDIDPVSRADGAPGGLRDPGGT